MTGTKAGAIKLRETLLKKYGGEEGLKEHYRTIGVSGGKASTGGGFAYMAKNDPERLKAVSAKGGKVKRGAK